MARPLGNSKSLIASATDALSLSITRPRFAQICSLFCMHNKAFASRVDQAILASTISKSVNKRGYAAAASTASISRGGEKTEMTIVTKEAVWALDPVRGYYRPQNCAVEIDPAELREILLNHKVRPH